MYRAGKEEIALVSKVIASKQWFRNGDPKAGHLGQVAKFEKDWAKKIGTDYCVSVTSGTAALTCALVGLGVGPGDEVLIPAYTFMATAIAVVSVGAIPVLCEVNESLTIDPADIERKAGPRTKAVIPVHMLGLPCDMAAVMKIAKKRKLLVLEDCAQADGGSFGGKRLGSIGDAGAFSFNYFKIISAGEGGAVVTDDEIVYQRALVHHDGGAAFRPYRGSLKIPVFIGTNYRLNEILGAVLNIQTARLDGILRDLRKARKALVAALKGSGLSVIPSNDPAGDCASHLGLRFPSEAAARAFAGAPGVGGWLPFDTGKHVYSNWDPILEHRGSCHEALNPFSHPANKACRKEYRPDMCPRTLEILKTTVCLGINPDWKAKDIKARAAACRKAAAAA